MRVGDLVKLTWEIARHLGASNVGIVTRIEDISREGSGRKDIAVTAVFGNWHTTQLEEYFEVLSGSSR